MFPPMRPKPTIPMCMRVLSSAERLDDGLLKPRETGGDVGPEMHPDGAAATLVQHLEIAARRGVDHRAEAVFASGHGDIEPMVGGDLKKDAGVGPALIGLPCRMQETRSEANAGRDPFLVADRSPYVLQGLTMGLVLRDIGEKTAVIAVMSPGEMGLQRADQACAIARLLQNLAIVLVRQDLDAVLFEEG